MTRRRRSATNVAILTNQNTDIQPLTSHDKVLTDYIPFGTDNLFPQACALLSRLSPNHRGVINGKKVYTFGRDITTDDKTFQSFLDNCNYEGERFFEVLKRLEHDFLTTGNAYIEVITDVRRSYIFINQIDATKVRVAKDNSGVIIHPNWRQYAGMKDEQLRTIPFFPEFKADKDGDAFTALRSVYHLYSYEPEYDYYGIPSWISGRASIKLDYKTNHWNLARLENAFKISGMLFVPVKDAAESKQVLDHLKREHTGEGNQDKLLVLTKSRARENEKADAVQLIQNRGEENGDWLQLHNMTISDVIVSHSWYRSLCSLNDNTGFETNRILNEYNIALSTYIKPRQQELTEVINKIFNKTINKEFPFEFVNEPPVHTDDGMYLWEVREKRGLPFDPNDIQQQKIIYNGSLIG